MLNRITFISFIALFAMTPLVLPGQNKKPSTLVFGSHLSASSLYNSYTSDYLDFVVGRTLTCDWTREKESFFLSSGIFLANYNYQLHNHVITYSYIDSGFPPNSTHYRGYKWNYRGAVYSIGLRGSLNLRLSNDYRKIQVLMGFTGTCENVIYRKLKDNRYIKYTRDGYTTYDPWTHEEGYYVISEEQESTTSSAFDLHKYHVGSSLENYIRFTSSNLKQNQFGLELKWIIHITGLLGKIDEYRFRSAPSIGFIWSRTMKKNQTQKPTTN